MKKTSLIPLFILMVIPVWLSSQMNALVFERISSDQGLSQSFVHCLLKDKTGFVWAGTQDGLNRFDGISFLNYYKENVNVNVNSLSSNYIWDLCQDNSGNIWIGTKGGGLCLLEPSINKFSTWYPASANSAINTQNSIRSIFTLESGNLLVGTESGLYTFNTIDLKFEKLNPQNQPEGFNNSIFSFERVSANQILVGSIGEIFIYTETTNILKKITTTFKIEGGIHSLKKSKNGEIWAGTGKGLFRTAWIPLKDSLAILQQFIPEQNIEHPISSSYISSLLFDEQEGLWIATDHGLNYLNTQNITAGFIHFKNDPSDEASISSNLIFDLLEVEPGIIWAATQIGINQFSSKAPIFKSFDLDKSKSNCGMAIHGMVEDAEGNVLACTEKGLVKFDQAVFNDHAINFSCFDKKVFPDMADEFLVSISPGNDGKYWVALRRGGFASLKFNQESYDWKGYKLPAGAYSNIGTNDLIETDQGLLWIASSGLGLWKLDQTTGEFSSFTKSESDSFSISGNYIFHLFEDSQHKIWISTADGGLCQFDPKKEAFNCFTHEDKNDGSISNNMVLSVFEDSQQRIWACTADGLNMFTGDGGFIRFYKKDGLPNNVVYGMLEDAANNLWISTDQGISKIRYDNDKLDTQNYSRENGLNNNEFNQHAFYKLKNNQLVFGTKVGLNYFNPANISLYKIAPQIVFTDFKLFNESVPIKTMEKAKAFYLDQHINGIQTIVLPHGKNFLSFEFAGINFEQAKANQYAYQMQGLDIDWVYCQERRFANYPGLKSGNYVFKVKAANHDGVWCEVPKSVKIIIQKPPWKTWWAYILYFTGIFTVIYSVFKYRIYRFQEIEKTKQQERMEFRKRSARDFHDEAGNQITKISLMSEIAKRKTGDNKELSDLLSEIGDNIQYLRSGMRDFIWVLDPNHDNLYETLMRLKEFANGIFEYSSIRFTTAGIDDNLKAISMNGNERRHLLMIFKEAINNCLKYSKAENARLELIKNGRTLALRFSDNGVGFDSHNPTTGYGLQNIIARANKINAECKIYSKINEGTTISVFINTTQMGD